MTAGLVLLGVAAVVVGVAALRPVDAPVPTVPDREGFLAGWSAAHDGVDPTAPGVGMALTRGWLQLVRALAGPLARRRVGPDVLTGAGLWCAAAALTAAFAGGRWPLLALVAVVLSGILDNLDGAVATLLRPGRTTPGFGYVLDSVADRLADGLGLATCYALGAPGALCVGAGAAVVLLEYTRARAGAAGVAAAVITPGERPTRIVLLCLALFVAGVLPGRAEGAGTAAAAATAGVCAISWVWLCIDVRRRLS